MNFTVVPVDLVFKYRITVVGGGTRQSHPVLNHPWDMGIRVAIVNTGDIFICKTCGLPIRNLSKAKTLVEESLPCQSCIVCSNASEAEMKRVQRDIHTMLSELVEEVYRDRHNGQQPTEDFKLLVKNKLQKETNPAEKKIDKIREAILAKDCSDDDLIRQVAASERALAGFFYISGTRKALINSPTVLRHWVALAQKIQVLDKDCNDPEKVFTKLGTSRYDLNLVRWSKLTGDNPVSIIRDPNYYKRQLHPDDRTRAKHLERHIKELVDATKHLNPKVTIGDLKSLLRFAGNECFITESEQVIEFRKKDNKYLHKYLLKHKILIVVDDLWFLKDPAQDIDWDKPPLPSLVTIFVKDKGAEKIMKGFRERLYLPNCVDPVELAQFFGHVEGELGASPPVKA